MDPKVRGNLPPSFGRAKLLLSRNTRQHNETHGSAGASPSQGLREPRPPKVRGSPPFQGEHRALHRTFALILPFLIAEDVL